MSPPTTLPDSAISPIIDKAVTLFPQPDSPTTQTVSPSRTAKLTWFTAFTVPRQFENVFVSLSALLPLYSYLLTYRLIFGSNASRSASPSKLIDTTVIKIAKPGGIHNHGRFWKSINELNLR